jgi:hypothetical protein
VTLLKTLGDVQYDALITRRLGAYLAGRDEILEIGKNRGIFSQPDRLPFAQLLAMSSSDRQAFTSRVVAPFAEFSRKLTELEEELESLQLAADNPYFLEVRDGVAVTASRARFVRLTYEATLARAEGRPFESLISEAEAEITKSETVVSRRRKNLWDPDPVEVLRNHDNPTVYDYGYLREADTLCFWKRERAQLRNVLLGESLFVPACVL